MKLKALKTIITLANNDCDFGVHKLLGMSRSSMWAHITELEKEVGVKLINRRKQNTSFTQEGMQFIPHAKKIYEDFERCLLDIKLKQGLQGPGELIIGTTKAVGSGWLMPGMTNFLLRHPNILVNIIADDYFSKKLENSADILVRPVEGLENFARKWYIGYHHGLFASQAYLAKHGTPSNPEELKDHNIIAYGEQEFSFFKDINWHVKGKHGDIPKLKPNITINSTSAIYLAAVAGVGICSTPIESNDIYKRDLIRVLPQITGPLVKTYFCVRDDLSEHKLENAKLFESFIRDYLMNLGVKIET